MQTINEELDRLMNAFHMDTPPETLEPALAAHLHDDDGEFPMIKHPLVNQFYAGDTMNAMVNAQYHSKRVALAEARSAENWHQYLNIVERPWRPEFAANICAGLKPRTLAAVLGWLWTDTEVVHQCKDVWDELWTRYDDKPRPVQLMGKDDYKVFCDLPDYVTVYRGCNDDEGTGLPWGRSWTLDEKKAEWFAFRFDRENMQVFKRIVRKELILAYFSSRNEQEIVLSDDALDLM